MDDDLEGFQKLVDDGVHLYEGHNESVLKAFWYITGTSLPDNEEDVEQGNEQEETEDVSEESDGSDVLSSESTDDWTSALGDDDHER